ncbi:aromatase/cyclase [Streptomyces radicis]|uniref:Cyclase n=1 Tax=Streptomyces radicis TaxID=1750517 RepID=A0A3A9WEV6_9ACTN|nr:aromatase/cyclase [Streptomyces radicis]RKN11545.1 cyclase [Streptomyces radicis]RKN26437.1 cyclase [Streptomyces radicis]
MGPTGPQEVEHGITVAAPAAAVYDLIADVAAWPSVFPPTLHAERVAGDDSDERIRVWATANGAPKSWTSRRRLDREALRVDFRQEVSSHPVAAMGGAWIVEPLPGDRSRVRLLHDYRAVDDAPEHLEWIATAVDRNSRAELAALRDRAELAAAADERTLTFDDALRVDGSAKDVYDFLDQAGRWDERLPHVARVKLTEEAPGLQRLEMDTRSPDGSLHTTVSYRVCFPHHSIVYKQTTLPALMTLHTGRWLLTENPDGSTTAVSRHTVTIAAERITAVLGEGAGLDEARARVRDALGANSRATLGLARAYAEGKR